KQGAEEYRRFSSQGKLSFVDIHEAWKTFEPATLPETASGAKPPTREAVEERFLTDWKAMVELRWSTTLTRIKKDFGESTGVSFLRRGLLAIEYRRYDEAKELFGKAAQTPDTAASALNNLGNLAMVKNDAASAEAYYKQSLHKDVSDARVQINL